MRVEDQFGRPLRNLRLSVVDRCNLRCQYCMPEQEYVWLPKQDILTFEELSRLVDVFTALGVDKVRLTGGEPLLRRNLHVLVRLLAQRPAVRDLALTTNGVLLGEQAAALREAGLHRITVSLDTLRPERFRRLMQRDLLPKTLEGIAAARAAGFEGLKIDSVIIRGCNDDELFDLLEHGRAVGAEVRFIEYMDVGGATRWSREQVVSRAEMLERIAARYGEVEPLANDDAAPADLFRLADGMVFGVISSTTQPFCGRCDRSRLTADGMWLLCLYAKTGTDLRGPLRAGATPEELKRLIVPGWQGRADRGAEERLRLRERAALFGSDELRRDPHLEMHTRGG
jgi:cyclic pyranopterin phosphate synthase